MSRLADYFVIVGYDHEKERSGSSNGKILQRFPKKDWPDTPFIQGIEWFCQPLGWSLSTERQEPRFFVSVLTDIDANRHYCACLCFNETVAIKPNKPVDEEEESVTSGHLVVLGTTATISHHSVMYAPKCLVLVSRLDYTETFRNCLGTIYTVYIENLPFSLETLIGNFLGCIKVPPPGGPQVRFSIGAGDKQALQPPLSNTLPVTGTCVSFLFKQLGITNVLVLFWAVMTEHKILFHSKSFTRLTESCRALAALIYPFRYSHVYIPILPASLIEVLSTPTPFIMGVHSSLQNEIEDLLDIIVADLDGGSIYVPESLAPPGSTFSSSLWETTQQALTFVLQPELAQADLAFNSSSVTLNKDLPNHIMLDKKIRAVFMRFFAQLLQGYRSCLTIIRIHPKPVITFHKAGFLAGRNFTECDFLSKVLDSMFFTGFVNERGPPWRTCDAWDELYSSMSDSVKSEANDSDLIFSHVQELAQILYTNENPNSQTYPQKVLKPPDGAFARIHQPPMPNITSEQVESIISEGMAKNNLQSRLQTLRNPPRIVPIGPNLQSILDGHSVVLNTARRLEVLRTCINYIFENKISDARKIFPAVMRTLKQRDARLTLCRELTRTVHGNKAVLDNQQFDLIVKLMNKALSEESNLDEHGVAAQLLPLSNIFCRKLCTGVMQFAYTCIQDHPVWKNLQFWEAAFYQDVQTQIKALYLPKIQIEHNSNTRYKDSRSPTSSLDLSNYSSFVISRVQEPSALEIAAEQTRLSNNMDALKQKELIQCEESTLYSQAIHYANRMVALLIPLEVNVRSKPQKLDHHHEDDTSVSNSVIESRSRSEHSDEGFDEVDPSDVENDVTKTVSRFIDRVCTEGGVTPEHVRNLHAMVPGVVHMHIETLEAVCRESKRHAPIQKQKIQTPTLLSGEKILTEPLRAYLVPDGRDCEVSTFLPAEGALFLTNYRVIFRGSPCDQLACEQSIVRAFPIATMTKEKRVSVIDLSPLDQVLPEGLQLRSCTFQLLKIAFDTEITPETIDSFRKLLNKTRNPPNEFGHFAFSSCKIIAHTPHHKVKEKNATLKGFAKRTLLRTAKKAGFKQKSNTKRKYVLPEIDFDEFNDVDEDDDGSDDNNDIIPRVTMKDIEKLKQRSYVKDWERLGFVEPQSGYRISAINCNYSLCRSYPAIILSPNIISDEQLRNLARCYKNQRIPLATWRHRNGAILFRGAIPHSKSVIGMLKSHPHPANPSNDTTGYHEQDRYFATVIENMPNTMTLRHPLGLSDSNLSLNSLLLAADDRHNMTSAGNRSEITTILTPDVIRKMNTNRNTFQTVRSFSNLGLEGGNRSVVTNTNKRDSLKPSSFVKNDDTLYQQKHLVFCRVPLYVIGEKSQSKSARLSEMCADFVPVDYTDIRHSRIAFKKLMRACLPSSLSNEPDQSFAKLLEQSEWLQQIRALLQLSGAMVDLIDLQGSSVTLGLEDGWDVTAQISSLAQLCLDPFYRTIEGFRILIEKEWLAFGHRFANRSNLKPNSSSNSPFAPTFLQFLDCVYQIQNQFPLEFEFNGFYLKFIAYHSVSCRFRTFLFDCEMERFDLGIASIEDKKGLLMSRHVVETGTGSDDDSIYSCSLKNSTLNAHKIGHSVFEYIEKYNAKNPIFFNFMYTPDPDKTVLRPLSSVAVLDLWSYYIEEELGQGPPYDPEVVLIDLDDGNDPISSEKPSKRKIITGGYDSIEKYDTNSFSRLLEELKQAEAERGLLPQKWRQVWDKLEPPHSNYLVRKSSFTSALVRSHSRFLHKKTTLEILMLGKLSGSHQETFSHPHRFEKHPYTTPTNCNHCDKLLWGPIGIRCMDCGNSYHEKCADSVPKNCTKYKAVERVTPSLSRSQGDNGSIASSATTGQHSSQQFYDQFCSNVTENRTHEGHLYKRGALLKGWKQRWFVLDCMKHQLRYYDAVEDSNCKGFIDLAEVQVVGPAPSTAIGTKKVDEKAFFDLKTNRRTYNFYATTALMAQEWIEKIQGALQ